MARQPSAILTPAEKKSLVADLKSQIKEVKAAQKTADANFKSANKTHEGIAAAAIKEHNAAIKANAKVVADFTKAYDKESAASAKTLGSLEAKLAELTAPSA